MIQWLKYGESLRSEVATDLIGKHSRLWREIYQTTNQAFSQSAVVQAFQKLCKAEHRRKWFQQVSHLQDWCEAMARRLRAQARHIANALGGGGGVGSAGGGGWRSGLGVHGPGLRRCGGLGRA
jgi:hypothetical protein